MIMMIAIIISCYKLNFLPLLYSIKNIRSYEPVLTQPFKIILRTKIDFVVVAPPITKISFGVFAPPITKISFGVFAPPNYKD
jgi:hypothetical protein